MDESIKGYLENAVNENYTAFEKLDIQLEDKSVVCSICDKYGVSNVLTFKQRGGLEKKKVIKWVDELIASYKSLYRLNNALEGASAFRVGYRYVRTKDTVDKSVIIDWDYSHVNIALSLDSLRLLVKNVEELIKEADNFSNYADIIQFLNEYLKNDVIAKVLNVEFLSGDVLGAFKGAPIEKDTLIKEINSLEEKSGTLVAETTLASKSLRVLAKVNWVVDFDNISCDLAFEENKVLSTRDMKYIHDSDIITGLLKLYKPSIQEIFG